MKPTDTAPASGTTAAIDPTARILFIGGGNMAQAMISGLLASGLAADRISVVEPHAPTRDALAARHPLRLLEQTPTDGVFDAIVLAVKPQQADTALAQSAVLLAKNRQAVLISIAAGLRVAAIRRSSGGHQAVVRSMPNTPALINEGVTGLHVPPGTTPAQAALAEAVLASTGAVARIDDEALIDTVTAVSGSGPAYVFYLIEAMIEAAVANGLSEPTARLLVHRTVKGAAMLAQASSDPAEVLRARVTSPGGTTAAAVAVLEARGMKAAVGDAIAAARRRGEELGA
jgi:pyrroline-5-carboxylate reductase